MAVSRPLRTIFFSFVVSNVFGLDHYADPRIVAAYQAHGRKHEFLFDRLPDHVFDDRFVKAMRSLRQDANISAIWDLVKEEVDGVYSFPIFTLDFCDDFLAELDNYYASGLPTPRPNSMNNYGIVVNQIGMAPMITALQRDFLQPLAATLFPEEATPRFDHHHSFMVRYRDDENPGLDMHTDDSDVTFNACLGKEFAGAGLTFCGRGGQVDHRQHRLQYRHARGRAVMHRGAHRHGADDIVSGERVNLIVWNHNDEFRRARAAAPPPYLPEAGSPDPRCLSYTHDRDYDRFRPLPARAAVTQSHGWCPPPHACYDTMGSVLASPALTWPPTTAEPGREPEL